MTEIPARMQRAGKGKVMDQPEDKAFEIDCQAAMAFVNTLLENVPDNYYAVEFELPGALANWCETSEQVVDAAGKAVAAGRNAYVGIGLYKQKPGPYSKGTADDVSAIVGLCADIDWCDQVHLKPGLPRDENEAFGLLERVGLEPSIITHTGHGLQAVWLFREAWTFDTDDERAQAAELSARWQETLKAHAKDMGCTIDNVGNLDRVIRISGTYNFKEPTNPLRVVHLTIIPNRYSAADFEAHLIDRHQPHEGEGLKRRDTAWQDVRIVVNPAANPPFGKFDGLGEIKPLFLASWNHSRDDIEDRSPSGWDMSLAGFAVQAFTDQEVCDLLIAHRRKYGYDLKLSRPDYYQRTIAKARQRYAADLAFEEAAASAGGSTAPDPAGVMRAISQRVGVDLTRIIKTDGEPRRYTLETATDRINIGGVDNLISQNRFRAWIADLTGCLMRQIPNAEWHQIARMALAAAVVERLGKEARTAGITDMLLTQYLEKVGADTEVDKAISQRSPFVENGRVSVFLDEFMRFYHTRAGRNLSNSEAAQMLKEVGAEPNIHRFRGTTRYVWELPPNYLAIVRQDV